MPKTKLPAKPKKPVAKKKQIAQQPATSVPRRLQAPKRIWYKPPTWRNHPPVPTYQPLSKARLLFWNMLQQLWAHKKLFTGIVVLYGLLNLLMVKGLSGSSDLASIKSLLTGSAGFAAHLSSSFGAFVVLLGTSGSGNADTSSIYQSILLVICSLAFIWALRQTLAKHQVRVRDSFYQGMYPLVPFLLMLLLLGLQLVPLTIGGSLYSTVISGGIAVHLWEKAIWLVLFVGLAWWSLRMVTASIFALYIVALPDMTPLRAYRSAKQLVYGRRLLIWRKLIYLPIMLLLLAAIIELPLILFAAPVAVWMFFVLSAVALPVVHGYLYNLYREML